MVSLVHEPAGHLELVCVRAAGPRAARRAVELGRASRRGDCRRWGRRSQEILVDICCELKGLEEAEKANGWPARAGKVAANRPGGLAKHYGLIASDAAARRKTGLRQWGTEDYRATLDAWRKDKSGKD
jgi:hypothetical protein